MAGEPLLLALSSINLTRHLFGFGVGGGAREEGESPADGIHGRTRINAFLPPATFSRSLLPVGL